MAKKAQAKSPEKDSTLPKYIRMFQFFRKLPKDKQGNIIDPKDAICNEFNVSADYFYVTARLWVRNGWVRQAAPGVLSYKVICGPGVPKPVKNLKTSKKVSAKPSRAANNAPKTEIIKAETATRVEHIDHLQALQRRKEFLLSKISEAKQNIRDWEKEISEVDSISSSLRKDLDRARKLLK